MSGEKKPLVGIVMGSDSIWPKIRAAKEALDEFGVPCEVRVMSAHRTPEVVRQYVMSARDRGLRVIIAAAGGAAHLAGVVAAHTTLPVIGLPVPTPELGGLDSLLSTVQMPGDVPVATVALGMGAANAGLFRGPDPGGHGRTIGRLVGRVQTEPGAEGGSQGCAASGDLGNRYRITTRRCAGSGVPTAIWCCSTKPACR